MSKFRLSKILPFAKLDKSGNVVGYEYQAYVSDGKETFVVGPEKTIAKARQAGNESVKHHNQKDN